MGEPQDSRRLGTQQWAAIMAIGGGVGWLIGHSASPVLGGVIASLLGIVAGIVTGLRSVGQKNQIDVVRTAVDARPAAVLVVTIALAATAGMIVKAHRLLEPSVVREAAWRAASQGRLEDLSRVDQHGALLFGFPQSECNALLRLKDNHEAFIGEVRHSSMPEARKLAERITDPQTLVTVVEVLCEQR
jgi:hypothetical protein